MTIPYIVFRITNLNRSNRLEKPIQSIPSFKWHSILKKSRAQRKELKTTDESIYYTGWKSELNLKHNEDALTSASKGSNFPFFFFFFLIFLQANSLKWFSLKNLARARQSILLVRLDKTYDRIRNTWNHLSKRNKRG